ncbi:MAG: hypothetical protein U0838_09755 [Chloroflexota bacterium]
MTAAPLALVREKGTSTGTPAGIVAGLSWSVTVTGATGAQPASRAPRPLPVASTPAPMTSSMRRRGMGVSSRLGAGDGFGARADGSM